MNILVEIRAAEGGDDAKLEWTAESGAGAKVIVKGGAGEIHVLRAIGDIDDEGIETIELKNEDGATAKIIEIRIKKGDEAGEGDGRSVK